MKISIFGLGYVGCVSAACLSEYGHKVIGVDIEKTKTDLINQGKATIIEKDLDDIIRKSRETNKLEATTDINYAVNNSDVAIICVGTPSLENGHIDLSYIYRVATQIGKTLKNKDGFFVVAIRSTVPPGTHSEIATIIEKESGKKRDIDFAMVSNPEFLREGTAVEDYYNPPFTLLGSDNERALEVMEDVYCNINAPTYRTDTKVAEFIKYASNSFHALKITFGNEIGNICKALGIDSHKVMDIFCKDTKLNISSYYLKPGFAYGGSCLPKDLSAVVSLSRYLSLKTPVLDSISISNEQQKHLLLNKIIKTGKKNIGILGLSFKAGTDDLRESPIVDVAERLIGKGFNVRIYDKNVMSSKLIGSNKSYIEQKLPHLSKLFTGLEDIVAKSDVLVITNKEKEFKKIFSFADQAQEAITKKGNNKGSKAVDMQDKIIFDLVRIKENIDFEGEYDGICW